jgi:hypothetical protein
LRKRRSHAPLDVLLRVRPPRVCQVVGGQRLHLRTGRRRRRRGAAVALPRRLRGRGQFLVPAQHRPDRPRGLPCVHTLPAQQQRGLSRMRAPNIGLRSQREAVRACARRHRHPAKCTRTRRRGEQRTPVQPAECPTGLTSTCKIACAREMWPLNLMMPRRNIRHGISVVARKKPRAVLALVRRRQARSFILQKQMRKNHLQRAGAGQCGPAVVRALGSSGAAGDDTRAGSITRLRT